MKVNNAEEASCRLNQMLYPTVRMRAKTAGGSGTVIFSGQNIDDKWETYVIGCHHVISGCVSVTEDWDSMLGRKVKREHLSTVFVEPFRYIHGSRCVGGAASLEADIVAYDERQDVALVKLRDVEREYATVANLIPKGSLPEIQVSNEVWCAGAALGHKPIMTNGHILSIDDEIEDLKFSLSSANSVFGNSGGAMFRFSPERDRYEFMGIPARITIMPKGFFDYEVVTWMGYGITADRVYKFLDDYCYQFIYDPEKSIEECKVARERKKSEAQKIIQRMYGVIEG